MNPNRQRQADRRRAHGSSPGGRAWRLQVSSGVGPVEVQRFVGQLLARMEKRFREHGLAVESVETVEASKQQDGSLALRSATLLLRGQDEEALSSEVGTHELVAPSPARGRHSRKRWYVGVTLEAADDHALVAVEDQSTGDLGNEVDVETFRSGGPGGQNVNRRETGVRVRHRETGISVRVTQERSQKMNLRLALATLSRTLKRRQDERQAGDVAARRLSHYHVERGNPVRSYVLDHRGELQTKT